MVHTIPDSYAFDLQKRNGRVRLTILSEEGHTALELEGDGGTLHGLFETLHHVTANLQEMMKGPH